MPPPFFSSTGSGARSLKTGAPTPSREASRYPGPPCSGVASFSRKLVCPFFACRCQLEGFRFPAVRPHDHQEPSGLQGAQTMTDIALVPLEAADEILMTTRDHPTRPLLIRGEPGEPAFLHPGEPSWCPRSLLQPEAASGRCVGVVQDAGYAFTPRRLWVRSCLNRPTSSASAHTIHNPCAGDLRACSQPRIVHSRSFAGGICNARASSLSHHSSGPSKAGTRRSSPHPCRSQSWQTSAVLKGRYRFGGTKPS